MHTAMHTARGKTEEQTVADAINLNAEILTIISQNREWEAWFFANWLLEATRYYSFQYLMEAEYVQFLDRRDHDKKGGI